MTVISKYAYKAVWDASELSKGLMNTRALFQAQKKIVEDSRTPFDRLAVGHDNLNKLIEKYPNLAKERMRLEQQLEKQYLVQEAALRKLDTAERARLQSLMTADEREAQVAARRESRASRQQKAMDRLSRSYQYRDVATDAQRMSSAPNWAASGPIGGGSAGSGLTIASLAKGAVVGAVAYKAFDKVSGSLSDLARNGIEANRELERVQITFEHFGGSAGMADEMIAKLRKMSADSGVSFKALSQGTAGFMSKGMGADESLKTMSQIAEITGGIPERMDRLAYAFSQVKTKGKLMAEELQQMAEQGFTPLIEIAQALNVDISQVNKEIERGNVTWDVFAKSLDMATTAGGRFEGFLEKFKGTSVGAANESAAAWESAYADLGSAFEPLTNFYHMLSTDAAKQTSNFLEFTGLKTVKTIPDEDPNVAARKRREQREQERADQLAAARAREQAALKEMAARDAEQSSFAQSGLQDQQFELIKKLVPDEELAKFERVYSLLTDYNKERAKLQAIENFKGGLGLGDMTSKLDAQAKAEFDRNESLRKDVEREKKRQELIDRAEKTAKQFVSKEDKQVNDLADLELARRHGGMSQEVFDREARKVVALDSRPTGMANSIRAGSQEAYQFMAGTQNRAQQEAIKARQEQKTLQERMIKAVEKVEMAVKDSGMSAAG